jgi:hypothetical protein
MHAGDAAECLRVQGIRAAHAAAAAHARRVGGDRRGLALPAGRDRAGLVAVGEQPQLLVLGRWLVARVEREQQVAARDGLGRDGMLPERPNLD